jgi:serine O-acetyltransferase
MDGPLYSSPRSRSLGRIALALLAPEMRALLWFRCYSALYRRGLARPAHVLYLLARRRTGCDLAMQAAVGPGLRLAHAVDIVVGPDVAMGTDCVLFNGVTLGNRDVLEREFHMPQLGNRVLVGTGAKVLGGIVVGDDARIGAGSVVLNSVAPGVAVAGVPARPVGSASERP